MTDKLTFATAWLDGCSGCHMSLLDVDEFLVDLVDLVDIVYSPLVDTKVFPEHVDVTLVEGAVSNVHDLKLIRQIRAHTTFLISLGDCAVTGNIPAMRNRFDVQAILDDVYQKKAITKDVRPVKEVPSLLAAVRPIHGIVRVDLTVPGCPPSSTVIRYVLTELLAGRMPDLTHRAHFG
jgi:NAD-reducing hydrogenase small subunit